MVEMYLLFKKKGGKDEYREAMGQVQRHYPYGVFGVLTTLVNIVSYWILRIRLAYRLW